MIKQILFRVITAILMFSLSCSDDNLIEAISSSRCDDGIQNGNETGVDCGGICRTSCIPENNLEGQLVSRLVLTPGNDYKLTGPFIVRDGATLEIEAGTTIKTLPNKNAYIAIAQGGTLFVWGSQEQPVVITSDSDEPSPGDWGGIIICGHAPTNNGTNARSEFGDYFYGGTNPQRSSGVIRYLRLEYTGEEYFGSNFNAITFYGVGSFTTVANIQTYKGAGNGFEFVGGTVNAENIVAINGGDTGIKITAGWAGNGKSWYVSNYKKSGISLGNNKINPNAIPLTDAILENISILGPFETSGISFIDGGGIFDIYDVFTSNLKLGLEIEGTIESSSIDDGNLNIYDIEFSDVSVGFEISNYTGGYIFFREGDNNGAGNRHEQPIWAENWTIGF